MYGTFKTQGHAANSHRASETTPLIHSGKKTSRSSGGKFGLRKVGSCIAKTFKGLRNWVTKAPTKKLKAFRIMVLVGMAVGVVCLGVVAAKAAPWVIAGGVLLGGGCLIYRCTRSNRP